MAAKKKPVIRSTQFVNTIDTSVERLNEALNKGEVAVARRSKDSLQQLALIRRLKKKKQTLLNRKNRATDKTKKGAVSGNCQADPRFRARKRIH